MLGDAVLSRFAESIGISLASFEIGRNIQPYYNVFFFSYPIRKIEECYDNRKSRSLQALAVYRLRDSFCFGLISHIANRIDSDEGFWIHLAIILHEK